MTTNICCEKLLFFFRQALINKCGVGGNGNKFIIDLTHFRSCYKLQYISVSSYLKARHLSTVVATASMMVYLEDEVLYQMNIFNSDD